MTETRDRSPKKAGQEQKKKRIFQKPKKLTAPNLGDTTIDLEKRESRNQAWIERKGKENEGVSVGQFDTKAKARRKEGMRWAGKPTVLALRNSVFSPLPFSSFGGPRSLARGAGKQLRVRTR